MKENKILKAIFDNITDIIVVEDNNGNVCYTNNTEINCNSLIRNPKLHDEFFDEKEKRWYELTTTTFEIDNKHYILKKYTHVTKIKEQQLALEIDGKTGLLRSEIFKENVEYLSKIGKQMILVLIDIDYFKKINDCYGHNVGDSILSKIGILIKSIFRNTDLLGRFGGDEIILSLVDIDLDVAIKKLEILRRAVSNIIVSNDNGKSGVTISAGCVLYDNDLTYNENINKVDEVLYFSKENGRNQTNSSEILDKKNDNIKSK